MNSAVYCEFSLKELAVCNQLLAADLADHSLRSLRNGGHRLLGKLLAAISISFVNLRKKSSSFSARYAILGILIVTTPTEPVDSPEPKKPPDFLRSSRRSRRSLQHILLTSEGSMSELI